MQRTSLLLLVMTLGCGVIGCSGNLDRSKVHPVRGKVVFAAPTPAKAMVVFHPVANSDPNAPRPFATLEKDGTFVLSTFNSKDGAPEGEYTVTVSWELPAKGSDDETGPDLLRNTAYAKPDKTPLKATVKSGHNELDAFQIKK